MAEENLTQQNTSPTVINGTILSVKKFLDDELIKCEKWTTSNKFIKGLFDSQRAYETAKGMGVGQTTILKFLGGNWKQWMVQEALSTLTDKNIDRKAIETLPTLSQARTFAETKPTYIKSRFS